MEKRPLPSSPGAPAQTVSLLIRFISTTQSLSSGEAGDASFGATLAGLPSEDSCLSRSGWWAGGWGWGAKAREDWDVHSAPTLPQALATHWVLKPLRQVPGPPLYRWPHQAPGS